MWQLLIIGMSYAWSLFTACFSPMPYIMAAAKSLAAVLTFRNMDDGMRRMLYTLGLAVLVLGSVGFAGLMYMRGKYAYAYAVAAANHLHATKCRFYDECALRPPSHAIDKESNKQCDEAHIICSIDPWELAMDKFMPPVSVVYGSDFTGQETLTLFCFAGFLFVLTVRFVRGQFCRETVIRKAVKQSIHAESQKRLIRAHHERVAAADPDFPFPSRQYL